MNNIDRLALHRLVSRAIKREPRCVEELCASQAPYILFLCQTMLANQEDAEDAAQMVLLSVFNNIHTLKSPQAYITWQRRLAVTVCAKMRRKHMKEKAHIPLEEIENILPCDDWETMPAALAENEEGRAKILQMVQSLPEKYSLSLLMYYYDDLSYEEIADVLNTSTRAVEGYLKRGRAALHLKLVDHFGEREYVDWSFVPMVSLAVTLQKSVAQTMANPQHIRAAQKCYFAVRKTILASSLSQGARASIRGAKWVRIGMAAAVTIASGILVASHLPLPENTSLVAQPGDEAVAMSAVADENVSIPASGFPYSQTISQEEIVFPVSEHPLPAAGPASPSKSGEDKEPIPRPDHTAGGSSSVQSSVKQPDSRQNQPQTASSVPILPPRDIDSPQVKTIQVEGRVEVKGVDAASPIGWYIMGSKVVLENISVEVDEVGEFIFEDLNLKAGRYPILLHTLPDSDFSYKEEDAAFLDVVDGKTKYQVVLRLEDIKPPECKLFLAGDCNCGHVNPRRIEFQIADSLPTELKWSLHGFDTRRLILEGVGPPDELILEKWHQDSPDGLYKLYVRTTDLAGNFSEIEEVLRVDKGIISPGKYD